MMGPYCECEGILEYFRAQLLADHADWDVTVTNHAVGGATSSDLLVELSFDRITRQSVAEADIVVITIGANDQSDVYYPLDESSCDEQCHNATLQRLDRNLRSIVEITKSLGQNKPKKIIITGYWNNFEDGEVGLEIFGAEKLAWSRQLTADSNAVIRQVALDTGSSYVDTTPLFLGEDGTQDPTSMLISDGSHPNAEGAKAIGLAIAAAHAC